jgi:nucleoside-diphosphate-sugar epimerase
MNRVFMTGATGFVGAAVARQLVLEHIETAVLIRPNSDPWRLGDSIRGLRVLEGTLEEPASYESALYDFSADTVIHLGWHGTERASREDPAQVRVNVVGAVELFLIAARAGCRHFIGAGSQAEYGPCDHRIYEDQAPRPQTLYGAAKLATFTLLGNLAEQHAVRLAWLRLFSAYGPRDNPGTLISYVTSELLAGRRPTVTTCDQIWDYLYIDDVAKAFLTVAQSDASGLFNVGSGEAHPLRETVERLRDLINPSLPIGFGEARQPPHAIRRLEPDVSRINRETGWAPSISLAAGLQSTVEWHQAQLSRRNQTGMPR